MTSINSNEFYDSERMFHISRLLLLGVPGVQPLQQYRMIPQIAEFPNAEFYGGRLVAAPIADTPWRGLQMATSQHYGVKRDDCFMSVMNCSLWRRRSAPSMFNLEYIREVADLALALIKAGMSQKKVMILSN
ncbi:hypothetical protein BDV35DRAFT_398626 [Aspergillus flavus]|uniref:Unnamed protein product n=3 Tax=Aspergillus subgen. Circumdati TaxID=2720871 RepID=A0AAN4YRI8_ASPOZ|nr:hypothetical protein BDV35DRAFT_398626 [Aspergillus flavus]GMF77045.1 unnamed protein product [Aspergillus oryzae]GMF90164.1 unnamed protein product [Aspergillus oryzae]GMG34967.1 unnamed protein product [Aspergillus oryzae]GMG54695.1 unnamed protein product [Aspergillus oryzae var. brunneus]